MLHMSIVHQETHTNTLAGMGLPCCWHRSWTRSNVLDKASKTIVASLLWRTSTTFRVKQTLCAQTPCSLTRGRSSFCILFVSMPFLKRGRLHLDWSMPSLTFVQKSFIDVPKTSRNKIKTIEPSIHCNQDGVAILQGVGVLMAAERRLILNPMVWT